MVLDSDCIRDVLLTIEKDEGTERISLGTLSTKLPKYSTAQLNYTCLKLEEGKLLELKKAQYMRQPLPSVSVIHGLTYEGHEFLNTIRDSKVWANIKTILKNSGIITIPKLLDVALKIYQTFKH